MRAQGNDDHIASARVKRRVCEVAAPGDVFIDSFDELLPENEKLNPKNIKITVSQEHSSCSDAPIEHRDAKEEPSSSEDETPMVSTTPFYHVCQTLF